MQRCISVVVPGIDIGVVGQEQFRHVSGSTSRGRGEILSRFLAIDPNKDSVVVYARIAVRDGSTPTPEARRVERLN